MIVISAWQLLVRGLRRLRIGCILDEYRVTWYCLTANLEEIKERLHTRAEYRVTWVRRTANVAAHKLAKVGVGDELCKVWLGSPPDFVLSVISDDIPSYAG